MEFDTPARIAILGAGPIGVEAALYARYLGYDVDLYERDDIAANVSQWGHVQLFTPFLMNSSPLGLAALQAQDPQYVAPAGDALLTGRQWIERYIQPLANTDLVRGSLRLKTKVLDVARSALLKSDAPGSQRRAEAPFRLIVEDDQSERVESADIVIDCTGAFGESNANPIGDGGVKAVGERKVASNIQTGLPDVLGKQKDRYAGKHTLVVGSGYTAATNIVALAELAKGNANTKVTWVVRRECGGEPIKRIEGDRLLSRDQLAAAANELASGDSMVKLLEKTRIDAIDRNESGTGFVVSTMGDAESQIEVDNVLSNTGYRPDNSIYRELQVHECYASSGPMKLAATLLANASEDCLDQVSAGAASLVSPEPNFYLIGSKSYGRNSNFLFSVGLQQIRDLFAAIVGRAELDLYKTAGGGS